jgi:hypothetical protein
MSISAPYDPLKATEQFYTMVKSVREFDKTEVRGVIRTLLSKTDREECFIGTYYRSAANVETLLALKSAKHCQAISMLARALFELAVDIRLIDVLPDGPAKMIAFSDVDKLRAARKIVKFKAAHPNATFDLATHDSFIKDNRQRIDATRGTLWPALEKGRALLHWSGQGLASRVTLVGSPFDEIYEVHYPRLSWHVHSGLTGIVNLEAEVFTVMCGIAFKVAPDSFQETLLTMIRQFKIGKATENIEEKLMAAKMLPFTDSPEQAQQLLRALGL